MKDSVRSLKDNLENKQIDADILNKELMALQKVLDKAAKNNVLHKNKANRLKSRYAKKITALGKGKDIPKKATSKEKTDNISRKKS